MQGSLSALSEAAMCVWCRGRVQDWHQQQDRSVPVLRNMIHDRFECGQIGLGARGTDS